MNNKWIRSFMTVAQEGSVTAAAKALFISPQALLQQINLLEAEMGTSLFIRQRSGMKLTLAGNEFLRGAQELETVYARTLNRCKLASQAENRIRIPMMSSIVLPVFMERVCAEYNREVPGSLRIDFISDEDFGGHLAGLRDLKYDIIEHYTVDGQVPQGIHFEYIEPVNNWCIMSELHPLASHKMIRPEDLEGCLMLCPSENRKLLGYLFMYMTGKDIHFKLEEIDNDRYKIIDGLGRGGIYMADEAIAKIFAGCAAVPLDFDTHVQHGFACREEMLDSYRPFFDVARSFGKPGK